MDREILLGHLRGAIREMPIAEWGVTLRLRKLSAVELEEFRARLPEKPDDDRLDFQSLAYVLACCVVDELGQPLLTEEEWRKYRTIESTPVALRIIEAIYEHSGLTGDPVKNSETATATAAT
jgi:hypothetical protein